MTQFPILRPRRLRVNDKIRTLVRECQIAPTQLIQPLFVLDAKNTKSPIATMPGIFRFSPDLLVKEVAELKQKGISNFLLFGVVDASKKDAAAKSAWAPDNPVVLALQMLKEKHPDLLLSADVCLCDYTDHGHCGLIKKQDNQLVIDNDSSLEVLSKISSIYARAGADIIAPSDMMDGRVAAIRDELDAAGFKHLPIMSYAAKYTSSFYGPFRCALQSTPSFGDRKSYQMDTANAREALREVSQDIGEGADIVMIKPAMPSLDIIAQVRAKFDVPIAAYQVSGEYGMIKAAAAAGMIDEKAAILESLICIKRAGADIIITYFAQDIVGDIQ